MTHYRSYNSCGKKKNYAPLSCGLAGEFKPSSVGYHAEGLYYGEAVTIGTFELLAIDLGVSGLSERRKAAHRIEREIRANWKMAKAREKWNHGN